MGSDFLITDIIWVKYRRRLVDNARRVTGHKRQLGKFLFMSSLIGSLLQFLGVKTLTLLVLDVSNDLVKVEGVE